MSCITSSNSNKGIGVLLHELWLHIPLMLQMVKRDIIGRYRGSIFGIVWSLITPIIMLLIYGFVFSFVFEMKWSKLGVPMTNHKGAFTVILFSGLMLHALLVETITQSASVIIHHANYVKKVVFPLEILVPNILLSSLFHFMISLCLLLAASLFIYQSIPLTALLLPLILLPFLLLILGISWFLAALGVYIRDIGQLMGMLSTILLFTSPIFFPVEALPEWIRPYMMLNPLTVIIESFRHIMLWGTWPNWKHLMVYYAVSITIFCIGAYWFQQTRKGFADVL